MKATDEQQLPAPQFRNPFQSTLDASCSSYAQPLWDLAPEEHQSLPDLDDLTKTHPGEPHWRSWPDSLDCGGKVWPEWSSTSLPRTSSLGLIFAKDAEPTPSVMLSPASWRSESFAQDLAKQEPLHCGAGGDSSRCPSVESLFSRCSHASSATDQSLHAKCFRSKTSPEDWASSLPAHLRPRTSFSSPIPGTPSLPSPEPPAVRRLSNDLPLPPLTADNPFDRTRSRRGVHPAEYAHWDRPLVRQRQRSPIHRKSSSEGKGSSRSTAQDLEKYAFHLIQRLVSSLIMPYFIFTSPQTLQCIGRPKRRSQSTSGSTSTRSLAITLASQIIRVAYR